MDTRRFEEFDIYKFGNELQFVGCVLEGDGKVLIVPFPDQKQFADMLADENDAVELLPLDNEQWLKVIAQSDSGDVKTPAGIILRKGLRQIESNISWRVYERDDFRCRYCGARKPLTVDHIDLWEDGGATVEANLISSCRNCNKTRGNTPYEDWLKSADYRKREARLKPAVREANEAVLKTLDALRAMRTAKPRSR